MNFRINTESKKKNQWSPPWEHPIGWESTGPSSDCIGVVISIAYDFGRTEKGKYFLVARSEPNTVRGHNDTEPSAAHLKVTHAVPIELKGLIRDKNLWWYKSSYLQIGKPYNIHNQRRQYG